MNNQNTPTFNTYMKTFYLYIVSFVALLMVIFSLADAFQIALKTYIFTKADLSFYSYAQPICDSTTTTSTPNASTPPCLSADQQKKQQEENMVSMRDRDLAHDIAYTLIGLPLFIFHWHLARKKE